MLHRLTRTWRRFRPRVAHRRLEWWLASFTAADGAWMMLLPASLDTAPYDVARFWAPAAVWGEAAFLIGIAHIFALWINGRCRWSPYVRAVAAGATALFFAILAAAIVHAAPWALTVLIHCGISAAGIAAFAVAAGDSWFALTTRAKKDGV